MFKLKTFAGALMLAPLLCGPGLAQSSPPAQRPMFADGPCSGVLCGVIGGSQAPQKSLFREGPCGGVLCDAIGGPQAPKPTAPPPPCGGGILCDMAPYGMGVPVTAGEAARLQAERARQEAAASAGPVAAPTSPTKPRKARHRRTASK